MTTSICESFLSDAFGFNLNQTRQPNNWLDFKEGHWQCYYKYIEQNFLSYYVSIQHIGRSHFIVVKLCEVVCSMYLE